MATLIRIKRRFTEEPTDAIVVEPKRLRTECTAAREPENAIPAILKRVATVNSKDEQLKPELLKRLEKEYKKGWELREQYKKLGKAEGFRDAAKRETKERVKNKKYMVLVSYRGNMDDEEPGEVKEDKVTQGNEGDVQGADDVEVVKCTPSLSSCENIKYYDAELPPEDMKDVITCNGVPMESEKYVYDIYYSPMDVGWEDYICNVQKYVDESSDDHNMEEEDDDDENDEDNWRNDYPEEEDSPNEDEDDYLDKQFHRIQTRDCDSDESYDADESDEENFNEDGDLIDCGHTNSPLKLRKHLSGIVLHSDSDDDAECDDDNFDNEGNLVDCKYSISTFKVEKNFSNIDIQTDSE